MNCLLCGGETTVTLGEHNYCAVDGVEVVIQDVETTKCSSCGDKGVILPKISQLNCILAFAIAKTPERLSPGEIRFLRKYLGWSGVDFAGHFGVTPETVSRWQSGAKQMGPPAERLLRFIALKYDPVDEYPIPDIGDPSGSKKIRVSMKTEWSLTA